LEAYVQSLSDSHLEAVEASPTGAPIAGRALPALIWPSQANPGGGGGAPVSVTGLRSVGVVTLSMR
jgi:hypothetical protein